MRTTCDVLGLRTTKRVVVNVAQKILVAFDGWQLTIGQLSSRCGSLPPITIDASRFDENTAIQAKCWLQTRSVSRLCRVFSLFLLMSNSCY